MHIVHFAPTPFAVPPPTYGGAERIVYWLARAQLAQGHRVTVVANPASRVHELHPQIRFVPWHKPCRIGGLLPDDCDIVHLHRLPEDFDALDRPYLMTEHANRGDAAFLPVNTAFVSAVHARLHGRSCYVHNGVPVEEFHYSEEKERFLLYLSRMEAPTKNARTAMDMAIDLNVPLIMSGKRSPWRQRKLWGDWCRHPLAMHRLVRRIGYIGGDEKLGYLARAAVLFHLVNWHEPQGLIVLEALASGTPVLATPNGALPELVEHGRSGWIARSYGEALDQARHALSLDAPARARHARWCRERTVRVEDMAREYMQLYERVLAGEALSRPDEIRPTQWPPVVSILKEV